MPTVGPWQTVVDLDRVFRAIYPKLKNKNPGAIKLTIQKFYRISGKIGAVYSRKLNYQTGKIQDQ